MKRQSLAILLILAFLAGFLFHSYLKPSSLDAHTETIAGSGDTAEVKKIVFNNFPNAYRKGDHSSQRIADLFHEDADMVILKSNWITRKQDIKERFDYLKDFPEGRTIYFELVSIFFVGDKVAWVNVNACDKGGFNEEGEPLEDYCDRGSFLLEKRNTNWKIKALRAFQPPLKDK